MGSFTMTIDNLTSGRDKVTMSAESGRRDANQPQVMTTWEVRCFGRNNSRSHFRFGIARAFATRQQITKLPIEKELNAGQF
jgi:hypothetical protein